MMGTNAGNGPHSPGITVSRFVIWSSASLGGCAANDQEWFAEFLRSTGYKTLLDIHGLAPPSLAGCANALEQVLVRNNLGVLAHAWWPADTADADAASHTLLNESVAVLELGVRSTNGLIHLGVSTIGELIRLSTEDLIAVRNLGRKSVFEIQEKLAYLQLSELRAEPVSLAQNTFSLAVLMNVGNFRLSKGLARSLERATVSRINDLVTRSPSALRESARFAPPELTELLIWLARFRLRLNMPHDGWLRAHFDELRAAFQEDIARVTAADAAEPESAAMDFLVSPTPAPSCLEDELEKLLAPGLSDKKAQVVRRFLGWDGGPGATLEETGQAFGVTRERIRQVIALSVQRPTGIDLTFLKRAIACIEACIPSVPERAEAALVDAGLVRERFRLESIIATAKALDVPVPWRLESWTGGRLVVNDKASNQIRRFHSEAKRRVSHYGVTRKFYVFSELSSEMTPEAADLACSVLEDLRWLDDAREWFWLSTGRNTVLSRLAKILVVAPKLRVEEAHAAVMRDRRMSETELPIEVFRNLCIILPWCRVAEGYVIAGKGVPKFEELESAEATLIDILQECGPSLRTADLRRLAMSRGIGDVFFYRLLSDSNLIVQHASDIYGLIGSDGVVSHSCPLPEPHPQELPELSGPVLDEPESKHVLGGCNADSPTFPMDVLARVVIRSAPFRQKWEMWSIVELRWTDLDQEVLRLWAQRGEVDLRKLCRESVTSGSLRFDGAEAVAVAFLATCCVITRAEGLEGEMWPSIQAAFGQRLRSRLFHGPGVPKIQIREASERICFKLGIRHLFGREGEQSWFRTVFLQFGMTRSGWQRLPWWLSQSSVLPVAIEDLLQSATLRSQSFGEFWRTLQRYRSGQLLRQRAAAALSDNPWVAPREIEAILLAAIERRDIQRVAGSEDLAVDQVERLFDPPLLCWIGDSPRFELRLRPQSRWLTEPRYVLVCNDPRSLPSIFSR